MANYNYYFYEKYPYVFERRPGRILFAKLRCWKKIYLFTQASSFPVPVTWLTKLQTSEETLTATAPSLSMKKGNGRRVNMIKKKQEICMRWKTFRHFSHGLQCGLWRTYRETNLRLCVHLWCAQLLSALYLSSCQRSFTFLTGLECSYASPCLVYMHVIYLYTPAVHHHRLGSPVSVFGLLQSRQYESW